MAYALLELNCFKSRNCFGKYSIPFSVIRFAVLAFFLDEKHEVHALRQLYFYMQV